MAEANVTPHHLKVVGSEFAKFLSAKLGGHTTKLCGALKRPE